MKNILTSILFLISVNCSSQYVTSDTAAIYLDLNTFKRSARLTVHNGDTTLFTIWACNNFWKDPIIFACDPVSGIMIDPDDVAELLIPRYVVMKSENMCIDTTYGEYVKEDFQFTSEEKVPYERRGGVLTNVYTDPNSALYSPETWEHITSFGVPDTSLADAPELPMLWPPFDCATGFAAGTRDVYWAWFPFPWPDGIYCIDPEVNFPPGMVDAGPWPHKYTLIMEKSAGQIRWLDTLICPDVCTVSIPDAPQNVSLSRTNLLGWDMVPGADSYTVLAQMAYQDHGWQWYDSYTVLADGIRGNRFQLPTLPNTFWRFYVKAVNCAGESPLSDPTKKDKQ